MIPNINDIHHLHFQILRDKISCTLLMTDCEVHSKLSNKKRRSQNRLKNHIVTTFSTGDDQNQIKILVKKP